MLYSLIPSVYFFTIFFHQHLHLVAKQPPHYNLFAHSKSITLGPYVIVLSYLNAKLVQ